MRYALRLRDVHKRYGRQIALDGLNLEIEPGTVLGLVGKNGAGKTTAMSIAAGLLRPDSGSIDLLGMGPFRPKLHRGRVTILPQDARLPSHSRVRDALVFLARLQGLTRLQAIDAVDEMLTWVDLKDRATSPLSTLSHGMFRRVTIAQAFLGSPELVLLDEPTSGLDPKQVVQIRYLIRSRRAQSTIVISSHILSELETMCDHVAFIENGRTIRDGKLEDVTNRQKIISYSVASETVPVEVITAALPDCGVHFNASTRLLTVSQRTESGSPADINARLLPVLLEHGVPILEIRLGSNLEKEYLQQVQ